MKTTFLAFLIVFSILFSIGFAETDYGTTWEETCDDGVCTRTLYSGVRYIFENETWKPIEDAHSLKDAWTPIFIEIDKDFTIEVKDYNYTDFEMWTNFTGNPLDYPEECTVKTPDVEAKCQFKIQYKEDGTDIKFDYKWEIKNGEVVANTYKFSYKGVALGKEFKFGGNSTTIMLQDADSENLEDTYVKTDNPEEALGKGGYLYVDVGDVMRRSMIKYDISSLPSDITIDESYAQFYTGSNSLDTGESMNMSIFHVYQFPNYNVTNLVWEEGLCDYSGAGCDPSVPPYPNVTDFPSTSEEMNLTFFDSMIVGDAVSFPGKQNFTFDTISPISIAYANDDNNVTFLLNGTNISGSPTGEGLGIYSKEYEAPLLRPYLNITYSYNTKAIWSTNQTSIPSSYNPNVLSLFNVSWNSSDISIADIDTVLLEINSTNYTLNNDTFGGIIYNFSIILGTESYSLKSYANTTQNEWNASDTWVFTIAKNASYVLTLANNQSWAATYPNHSKTTGSGCPSQITCTLYQNSSGSLASATNPHEILFGIGTYNYVYNTSGNANYSSNTTNNNLTIAKNTTKFLKLINNISWSGTYPSHSNTTGYNCPSGLTCILYRNDTGSTGSGDPKSNNVLLGRGYYNYTYNFSDTVNYTYYSNSTILNISQNTSNPVKMGFSVDDGEYQNNTNVTLLSSTGLVTTEGFLAYLNSGTIDLFYNGISVSNPDSRRNFVAGTWAFLANTSGNANYSANSTGLTFYVTAPEGGGAGISGPGGPMQIIAPNISFTLEPGNPVLIAPIRTEFIQNITYKVCSQHTNNISIDVSFNYDEIRAIIEKPFLVAPGECRTFPVEVRVFNLTEEKEYSIGMVVKDINTGDFRTSTITISTQFFSGAIKDVINFFTGRLFWSPMVPGEFSFPIPFLGLWITLGAFTAIFMVSRRGLLEQKKIRGLRHNKSVPFVLALFGSVLMLVVLVPV